MKFTHLLAVSAILLMPNLARSESVSYEFLATIDSLFSYENSTDKITHLTEGGFLSHYFKIGLPLYGQLTFDTKAPLSPFDLNGSADGTSIYENGVQALSVARPGFSYQAGSGQANDLYVSTGANSSFGWDKLYFSSTKTFDPEYFEAVGISFINYQGIALNGFDIPNRLLLDDFEYAKLDYTWLDKTTKNQFHVFANIEKLEFVTAVPEPDTKLMLIAGMLAVGTWRLAATLRAFFKRLIRNLSTHIYAVNKITARQY